jgi:NAD(P)-dependent dehydrogenase (short-subunit alcohol dehydrogenase family)
VALGAKVVIWDTDGPAATAAAGAIENRSYDIVDAADPATITSALAAAETRLGPPDNLVNNAGISWPNFPLAEYPPENL